MEDRSSRKKRARAGLKPGHYTGEEKGAGLKTRRYMGTKAAA